MAPDRGSLPEGLLDDVRNCLDVTWEDPDTELLGLYDGIPLTERAEMPWQLPDRIVVFRGPLTRHCRSRAELEDEITVTVMHEVGHFFGIEEDRLHELGWG